MNTTPQFVLDKTRLLNLVWDATLATGDQFEELLDMVEACESPEELARAEKAVRLVAAKVKP